MRPIYRILLIAAVVALPLFAAFAEETPTAKPADDSKTVTQEAAPVAQPAYPLDYCVVSGEKLNEKMGGPVTLNYRGREVQFCCKGCVKDFNKDPDKYLKKLDDAIITKEKDSYPLQTCVVSGEKLGEMGAPVDRVYNNQLVRFCCPNCPPKFEKDPAKYLSMIAAARASKAPQSESK